MIKNVLAHGWCITENKKVEWKLLDFGHVPFKLPLKAPMGIVKKIL